jgi:uncharacterized protein (TIGR00730 family)
MYTVCVFCGTAAGSDPLYAEAARQMARLLAQSGCRVVYGGGKLGLMGVVAQETMAAGGYVIGVAPKLLVEKEVLHRGLSELHVVETMHQRKAKMTALADAFVILPGGYGTLDELFEVLTLQQLKVDGVRDKPCGLLNVHGFFDALAAYLDHATASGFLQPAYRNMLHMDADPRALLAKIGVPQN